MLMIVMMKMMISLTIFWWYADHDLDGFGNNDNTIQACVQPRISKIMKIVMIRITTSIPMQMRSVMEKMILVTK